MNRRYIRLAVLPVASSPLAPQEVPATVKVTGAVRQRLTLTAAELAKMRGHRRRRGAMEWM